LVEVEVVRALISSATNREFLLDVNPRYPLKKDRVRWFLSTTDVLAETQSPFVHVVWMDLEDTLHIETGRLGNTTNMIEWIYGEVPNEAQGLEFAGFEKGGEKWEEMKVRFPHIINLLTKYEVEISQLSKVHDVPLQILYHGSKGLMSFRIEARVGTKNISPTRLAEAIESTLAALKDAYYRLAENQKSLADAWGHLPASDSGSR